MSNWDVAKAASWIASLGEIYTKYAENFVANQVDGEVLLKYVDQESIRDLVDLKLHQRVILGALDHLKAQVLSCVWLLFSLVFHDMQKLWWLRLFGKELLTSRRCDFGRL